MINAFILQGRLVADPECGTTTGGVDYANFRLAWNKKYKEKESKLFIECKAFSGTAKFVREYFKKGSEMNIEGELTTEEWESEGNKRSKIVCIVSRAHFTGGKKQDEAAPSATAVGMPDGELPF